MIQTEFAKVEKIKKTLDQQLADILFVVVSILMPLIMGRVVLSNPQSRPVRISHLA